MNAEGRPSHGPLLPLMRTVWLQVLRRKDMYLLAFIMIVFGVGSAIARLMGSETVEMVLFIGSLGYTLSSALAGTLVIIVAPRLIPAEIESRTIYPVLAKPVSRAEFLLGRFLPAFLAGVLFYLACIAVTFLITPKLPFQSLVSFSLMISLKVLSLGMLTAMMISFSLLMPSSLAMVLGFFIYFLGGGIINALGQAVRGSGWSGVIRLLPDFSLLDHSQRYLDAAAGLPPDEMTLLLVYGAMWTAFFAGLALFLFNRRPL